MKLTYTTADGRLTVELEAETQTGLWKELAAFQDVFEDNVCVKNGKTSEDVRYIVRTDDEENEYFEKRVASGPLAGTKKSYGQYKKPKGYLFAKSKDKDGNWLPDNGWVKYNKETGKEE